MLVILLNLKKLVKFKCNTTDMGKKYCQKQPMFSKIGCRLLIRKQNQPSLENIFSAFLPVLCILCIYLIFFIFIQVVFHYYILFRYLEKVFYGWANSKVYLKPSETSKMELFMKIINGLKPLTISAKTFHHVVITYILNECFISPYSVRMQENTNQKKLRI